MMNDDTLTTLNQARDFSKAMHTEMAKVIVGQSDILTKLIISLLCGGHTLMVGVPGLAKTRIVSSLAACTKLSYHRIQFTPDLMPADITGTNIIEENQSTGQREFKFIKGPVFANIVLADEINRTPPKTQSALLEAMQEHSVSVGNDTMPLPEPYFVLATQNPIEQEGTYPLPEAQLDRFLFNLTLDYPNFEDEVAIVETTTGKEPEALEPLIEPDSLVAMQKAVRQVPASRVACEFAVKLVQNTRPNTTQASDKIKRYVRWGAGPRASQNLILGAKAHAVLKGRHSVEKEDIVGVASDILRHRLLLNYHAQAEKVTVDDLVRELLEAAK